MTGPGRLADDLLPHPGRRALPLRHLLPAHVPPGDAGLPAVARRRHQGVARGRRAMSAPPPVRSRPGWPTAPPPRCPPPRWAADALDSAAAALRSLFDSRYGGFGGAPKFPPSMACEFLLRHHERTGSGDALRLTSLDRGADGPRRDVRPARGRVRAVQRGRAVGRAALREDALRQRACCCGCTRTSPGPPAAAFPRRVAEETAAFLLRDLRTPEGGFASAARRRHRRRRGPDLRLDAPRSSREVLGDDDGAWAASLLRGDRGGHVRARVVGRCSCSPTRTTPPAGRASARRCSRRATPARSRPATTR